MKFVYYVFAIKVAEKLAKAQTPTTTLVVRSVWIVFEGNSCILIIRSSCRRRWRRGRRTGALVYVKSERKNGSDWLTDYKHFYIFLHILFICPTIFMGSSFSSVSLSWLTKWVAFGNGDTVQRKDDMYVVSVVSLLIEMETPIKLFNWNR